MNCAVAPRRVRFAGNVFDIRRAESFEKYLINNHILVYRHSCERAHSNRRSVCLMFSKRDLGNDYQ